MEPTKGEQNGKGDSKLQKKSFFVSFWKVAFCILGIVTIVGGIILPWLFQLFFPIFWPQLDISSLSGFMESASIIVSFLSLGLGAYSVWQARESEIQMAEALSGIHSIDDRQKVLMQSMNRAIRLGQKSGNSPKPGSPPSLNWDPPANDEQQ